MDLGRSAADRRPTHRRLLLWTLRAELPHRWTRGLLVVAFAAGAAALTLDIATRHPVGQLAEELLEVLAETVFLVAMLSVVEGQTRALSQTPPSDTMGS